jgi:hypothetical protein
MVSGHTPDIEQKCLARKSIWRYGLSIGGGEREGWAFPTHDDTT